MSDWNAILAEFNGSKRETNSRSNWKPMYDGLIIAMNGDNLAEKTRYLVTKGVIPAPKEINAYQAFAAIERRRKKSCAH
jgi:hypothetical protein